MKKAIIPQKCFLLFLVLGFTLISSCSSENTDDYEQTLSIVGKWHNYKRVEKGVTYTDISNLNYEFQTNACIVTEKGDITNYVYKVDGNYIKFYNPKTEIFTLSERIILLTKNELVVENDYNSNELKYFKRL
jgi:hypothetical protein